MGGNGLMADTSGGGNSRYQQHHSHRTRKENATSIERRYNISLSTALPPEWQIPLPKKSVFYNTAPPR